MYFLKNRFDRFITGSGSGSGWTLNQFRYWFRFLKHMQSSYYFVPSPSSSLCLYMQRLTLIPHTMLCSVRVKE
jgi:hypothetical protein